MDVVPRHSRVIISIDIRNLKGFYVPKVFYSDVRVIDTRVKDTILSINIVRLIKQFMGLRIHSSIAEIKATNIGYQLIDYDYFFMV